MSLLRYRIGVRGEATVDDEVRAGDVRGIVRGEEGEGGRHVGGVAEPADRHDGEALLAPALHLLLADEVDGLLRVRRPGADRVDADAVPDELDRHALDEVDDARLRRAVRREEG